MRTLDLIVSGFFTLVALWGCALLLYLAPEANGAHGLTQGQAVAMLYGLAGLFGFSALAFGFAFVALLTQER